VGCITQFSCLVALGCYVYPPVRRQRDGSRLPWRDGDSVMWL